MSDTDLWTDGNALAGHVQELFRVDLTTAIGRCSRCGRAASMAEVRVFDHAPGVVARCLACDQVLLRLVQGPGAPGWTCAACPTCRSPQRPRAERRDRRPEHPGWSKRCGFHH